MRSWPLGFGLLVLVVGAIFCFSPAPEWFDGAQETTIVAMIIGAIMMAYGLMMPDKEATPASQSIEEIILRDVPAEKHLSRRERRKKVLR